MSRSEIRPGPGGADHHLRRAALQGRGARRGPRAAAALCRRRPAVQADPGGGGEAPLGRQGAQGGAPARGGGAPVRAGGRHPRHLREDRGALPQRLDPCRGRGDRRPCADRARAALPRPQVGDARDPVQHEMGGGGGAREVRLPRPQDADGDPERRGSAEAARGRGGYRPHPARRRGDLCALCARRHGGRVPGGIGGDARRAAPAETHLHRGHRGTGRALPPGADGEHPDLLQRQERVARPAPRSTPRSTTCSTRPRASSSTRSR